MKKLIHSLITLSLLFLFHPSHAQMLITGVIDGDLPGGTPKAIEFFVTAPISDLTEYGFGVAQNGGGSDGQEYTFNGSANQGDFIYFAHSANNGVANFQTFFGFSPDFAAGNGILSFNGNDAIELFRNGNVIDVFGEVTHGGNPSWSYTNGWAQRDDFSAPSSSFSSGDWTTDANALAGGANNGSSPNPFPIGAYNHGTLPVTLTNFQAKVQGQDIVLNWTTEQEMNNAYFEIERKASNEAWKSIGKISGHGTSTEVNRYLFVDGQPIYGENIYRLKQVDLDGTFAYSFLSTASISQMNIQAYPNPFTSYISIQIQAPKDQTAYLTLFDLMGHQVTSWKSARHHEVIKLNLDNTLSRGIYYLKVEIGSYQYMEKLIKR